MSGAVEERFVTANLPPHHKVFFAVMKDGELNGEHDKLKSLLTSSGGKYDEFRWIRGRKTVAKSLFQLLTFGRRVPDEVSMIAGSTDRKEVIEAVFDLYQFYWESYFTFPFVIAKDQPAGWPQYLAEKGSLSVISTEMIETSQCILLTQLDHGIDLISDKVKRSEVESIGREIARQFSLRFNTYEVRNDGKLARTSTAPVG